MGDQRRGPCCAGPFLGPGHTALLTGASAYQFDLSMRFPTFVEGFRVCKEFSHIAHHVALSPMLTGCGKLGKYC